tara:strand:+ start:3465 stop:3638 length:174 start_codon:yes stop_codon:yes gene_type:complete
MAKPKEYSHSMQIKLTDEQMKMLEEYRKSYSKIPNRSEAVRDLIEIALKIKKITKEN